MSHTRKIASVAIAYVSLRVRSSLLLAASMRRLHGDFRPSSVTPFLRPKLAIRARCVRCTVVNNKLSGRLSDRGQIEIDDRTVDRNLGRDVARGQHHRRKSRRAQIAALVYAFHFDVEERAA